MGRGCLLILISLLLTACTPRQLTRRPQPYYGPTLTLPQVVAAINRNNRPVTTLWARQSFEADLIDADGQSHFVNGDGSLIYRKPRELKLTGTKPFVKIFEIGSTEDRYWLEIPEQLDTLWWGWYRNVGKPCVREVPIRPDLMIEVLGISDIDANLLTPPVPVMRFNPDADAYMLVWDMPSTSPQSEHWIAQKEIWYDRKTLRPTMVLLFDPTGRVVLRAYLGDYTPVEMPGQQRSDWPNIATNYRIFFPDTGSTLTLQLKDVKLSYKGAPRPGSIRFPVEPEVSHVMQVDADCDP